MVGSSLAQQFVLKSAKLKIARRLFLWIALYAANSLYRTGLDRQAEKSFVQVVAVLALGCPNGKSNIVLAAGPCSGLERLKTETVGIAPHHADAKLVERKEICCAKATANNAMRIPANITGCTENIFMKRVESGSNKIGSCGRHIRWRAKLGKVLR